jgi:hypothetical protein
MASTNNDKGKNLLDDDHQNLELEEEVEIEAKEEIEEDQHSCLRTTVASIGVVANPSKFKKGVRMRTGGNVPHHFLAPRTSSSGSNNPSILQYMSINSKGCLRQSYPLVGI